MKKELVRRPWIGGNWKMYKTVSEAVAFAQALVPALPDPLRTDVAIAAPFTALFILAQLLKEGGGHRPGRTKSFLGAGRGLHRRGFRADA